MRGFNVDFFPLSWDWILKVRTWTPFGPNLKTGLGVEAQEMGTYFVLMVVMVGYNSTLLYDAMGRLLLVCILGAAYGNRSLRHAGRSREMGFTTYTVNNVMIEDPMEL